MKEIWKDIEGYEGLYQISNFGRIKSLERKCLRSDGIERRVNERILIQGNLNNTCGGKPYKSIQLYRYKKMTLKTVHRLVMKAFLFILKQGLATIKSRQFYTMVLMILLMAII